MCHFVSICERTKKTAGIVCDKKYTVANMKASLHWKPASYSGKWPLEHVACKWQCNYCYCQWIMKFDGTIARYLISIWAAPPMPSSLSIVWMGATRIECCVCSRLQLVSVIFGQSMLLGTKPCPILQISFAIKSPFLLWRSFFWYSMQRKYHSIANVWENTHCSGRDLGQHWFR